MDTLLQAIKSAWHFSTDSILLGYTVLIASLKAYWTRDGSWVSFAVSWIAGIVSGYVFTDAAVAILGLDPNTYRLGVAGLVILSGENVMKWIIRSSIDPVNTFKTVTGFWRKSDE